MRKILVLRGGALGDFLVTLPALRRLRERWPEARIELAGNATAAQLARTRGLLDAVHSQHEARWSALFGAEKLALEFAAWLQEFDLVLNYWPDPDGALRAHFPLRPGQTWLSAEAMPARSPAAAHYCEPLRQLGLETRDYVYPLRPKLKPTPDSQPSFTVLLHPGSGSPRKNWPWENWLALIPQISLPLGVILGEAEAAFRFEPPMPPQREGGPLSFDKCASVTLLRQLPLEELVTHLSSCRLFLGHDSGISHLAAACGARCVLLFGPTDPAKWAPPAPNVQVLRCGPDLRMLSVAEVQRAMASALADQT